MYSNKLVSKVCRDKDGIKIKSPNLAGPLIKMMPIPSLTGKQNGRISW